MKTPLITLALLLIAYCMPAQEIIHFSKDFQKKHEGKYKVEVHETKELLQIMLAITPAGKENSDLVEQEGSYYQDLIAYYKPYENEPILKTFDSLVKASIYNFIFLTANAISYDFKGDQLIPNKAYEFPSTGVADARITENPITTYKNAIEAFAKKSNFRAFYKAHEPYYAGIIHNYEEHGNLEKQWKWLESNFDTRINSYIIYCSPLIHGLNYTYVFDDNHFKMIHMILPPLGKFSYLTEVQNEIFNTRVMFTEIDHNYVGPPSAANKAGIDTYFGDRSIWVDEKVYGVFAYPTPSNVFNEYMTYGVFLLYCKEYYEDAQFKQATGEVIQLMNERGFPKMKEFTDKLLKERAAHPDKKIDTWYPEFLEQFKS